MFEKMAEDRDFDLFGGPKWPKSWASVAHILHPYKSTWNEHMKQYCCDTSENFLKKWPNTRNLSYFGAQNGPEIGPLTHWGREKMDAISQTTFSGAFSKMKMFEFRLKCRRRLFIRVQITIFQHRFRWWLGAVQATSHYLNQWWLVYRRIKCVTRPQWVKRHIFYTSLTVAPMRI